MKFFILKNVQYSCDRMNCFWGVSAPGGDGLIYMTNRKHSLYPSYALRQTPSLDYLQMTVENIALAQFR